MKNKNKKRKFVKIIEEDKDRVIVELSEDVELSDLANFTIILFTLLFEKFKIKDKSTSDIIQLLFDILVNFEDNELSKDDIYSGVELNDEEILMAETFSKIWNSKKIK